MDNSIDNSLKPHHIKNSLSDPTFSSHPTIFLQHQIRDYLQKDKEKKLPKLKLKHSRDVSFLSDKILTKNKVNPISLPKTLSELKNLDICRSFAQLDLICVKSSCVTDLITSRDITGGSVRYLEGLNKGTVSGRKEAENLLTWFNLMKEKFEHETEFEIVIWKCAEELCRQITVDCRERGELFKVIFGFFQKMFDSKSEELSEYCENLEKGYKRKISQLHVFHLEEIIESRNRVIELEKINKEKEEIIQGVKKELVLYKKKLFKICTGITGNKGKRTEVGYKGFFKEKSELGKSNNSEMGLTASFNCSERGFAAENQLFSVQVLEDFKEKNTQTNEIITKEQTSQYENKGYGLEIEKVHDIHFEPFPVFILHKGTQANLSVSVKHELKRSNNLRLLSYKINSFEDIDRVLNRSLTRKTDDSKDIKSCQNLSESESNSSFFEQEKKTEKNSSQEKIEETKNQKKKTKKKKSKLIKGKSGVSLFSLHRKRITDVPKINILPENLVSFENKEIENKSNSFRKKSNSFVMTRSVQAIPESQIKALKQNQFSPIPGQSNISPNNFQVPLKNELISRHSSISLKKKSILKNSGLSHSLSFHEDSEQSNDESAFNRPGSPSLAFEFISHLKRNSNICSTKDEFSLKYRKKSIKNSRHLQKLKLKFFNICKKNKKKPAVSLKNIRKTLYRVFSNPANEDVLCTLLFDFNQKYGLKKVTDHKCLEFLFSAFKYKEKKICKGFFRIAGFGELIGCERMSEYGKKLYLEIYAGIINGRNLAVFNEDKLKFYVRFSKFCDFFKSNYGGSFPEEGLKKLIGGKFGELVSVDKLLDEIIKIYEKLLV